MHKRRYKVVLIGVEEPPKPRRGILRFRPSRVPLRRSWQVWIGVGCILLALLLSLVVGGVL